MRRNLTWQWAYSLNIAIILAAMALAGQFPTGRLVVDSYDCWTFKVSVSGHGTFTDKRAGYGGGNVKLDFDFNADTSQFTLWDFGLPEFNSSRSHRLVPSQGRRPTRLAGSYEEYDWTCVTEPRCMPVKLNGQVYRRLQYAYPYLRSQKSLE